MSIKNKIKNEAEDVCAKADILLSQAKEWAKENPESAAAIACTAIGAIGVIIRRSFASARIRNEQKQKNRYIYDRSLGMRWKLKRAPTQGEQIAIATMKKTGMSYVDILTKLKLL